MINFEEATFGDFFNISSSKRVLQKDWRTEGVPFYRAREIVKLSRDGKVDNELFISEELYQKFENEHGVPKAGDLMVSAVGTLGACYVVNESDHFYYKDASVLHFEPKKEICPQFFYHLFATVSVKDQIQSAGGSTVGTYTIERARKTKINVPSLAEQKHIAAILDKAAEIKAKREHAIAKLDELAQSTFMEMFGDLALNEMNWDTKTLKEISVTKGQYGGGFAAAEFQSNLPRYVRITDITDDGELKPDAVSADGKVNDFENYYLRDGDLLFARSGATVGKAYLHKSKLPHIYAGYLIRFVIDVKQALPEYVYAVTRTQYYKNWVLSKQNVVAQPNINAQQYGDLKIPVPPLQLQYDYVKFRDALLKQKQSYDTTAETLSSLLASLQHQAFTTGFNA